MKTSRAAKKPAAARKKSTAKKSAKKAKAQPQEKSWQEWINENLLRGCDPKGIVEILLQRNFPLADIRAMMGIYFPEQPHAAAPVSPTPPEATAQQLAIEWMRKRDSLAMIQRQLYKLSPKTKTIDYRYDLSREEFLEEYYAANRPVVIRGMMKHWEAPKRWTPQYLKAVSGREMVEIMEGRNRNPSYEMQYEKHTRKITFAEYVDMVESGRETNDYYLVARSNFFQQPVGIPLMEDVVPFRQYLQIGKPGHGWLFWYGPKGTVTPLHEDTINILMAQVQGRKHIKLIPANELDLVYNNYGVYSPVDCENPDYAKFPKYREASVIDLELQPGELLFLPVGWWHHVRALDTCITVTFTNFLSPNNYEWYHLGAGGGSGERY